MASYVLNLRGIYNATNFSVGMISKYLENVGRATLLKCIMLVLQYRLRWFESGKYSTTVNNPFSKTFGKPV